MIAFDALVRTVVGLDAAALERWIEARWVLPERSGGGYVFTEIDVARVHLIVELRDELMIDEEAMPVVLNLLDQVYALRHQLASLAEAIDTLPPDLKARLYTHFKE